MQKWEYLYFWFYGDKYRINREKEIKYKPNESFHTVVGVLGKEGWELVAVDRAAWIFKRSLE